MTASIRGIRGHVLWPTFDPIERFVHRFRMSTLKHAAAAVAAALAVMLASLVASIAQVLANPASARPSTSVRNTHSLPTIGASFLEGALPRRHPGAGAAPTTPARHRQARAA